MIQNIVFDMGQVMIRFDPEMFMDRAGIEDPKDRKMILNEMFKSVEWAQMDEGVLTEETAEPSILTRFPERMRKTVHDLLYNWAFPREMIPGMEDLVSRLKTAGYGIWLLSNASMMQPLYWNKLPVSRLFDGTMISAEEKTVKPCSEIYRRFTERFSLQPEECLFIDDAPINVAGAIACGWKGIVFHGDADELEEKLLSAGVRFNR